ncbi:MAG: Crp/Fnr family transcriptional regulator [Sphingobium sp.]
MGKRFMGNAFVDKLRGCAALSPDDVDALVQSTAVHRSIPARYDLIREGDRPGPVFVVLEGWACRYKVLPNGSRQVLAYLMPGDCCDLHVSLLAEMDHSIQTVTACVVATIERGVMEALLERHPAVARALYVAQLIDEGTLRAWITSMGRRTSLERAAHLMCELYLRARISGPPGETELVLPLSQLMLADSLGMTPVHLNRVLKQLRACGAMTSQRGSLQIVDPILLAKIAGFDENYLHRRLRSAA